MAQYSPSYYGPVSQNSTGGTTVDSQTQGSIAVLVQQYADDGGEVFSTGEGNILNPLITDTVWTEKFKGPWSVIKELPYKAAGGYPYFKIGAKRSSLITSQNFTARFSPPSVTGMDWYVNNVKIQQLEAGDHGIITVSYKSHPDDWTCINKGDTDVLSNDTISWTMNFESETMPVLGYCKNGDYGSTDLTAQPPGAGDSRAQAIIDWYNCDDNFLKSKKCFKAGNSETGISCALGSREIEIAEYYAKGVNPIFHYPVVTRVQKGWRYASSISEFEVGDNLDTIDTPSGCPFNLGNWEWVKIGSTFNCEVDYNFENNATTNNPVMAFTYQESWRGSLSADQNFYGSNKWEFGAE